jgi:hypothetical protein
MNNYFNFGSQVAASLRCVDRKELNIQKGRDAVMSTAEAAPFNRQMCKIAYAAYSADGDPSAPAAILFRNLASAVEWHSGFDIFSDCVKRSLAKQAMLLPAISGAISGTRSSVATDTLRTLVATGALGGATIGSLAFLLGRNASQTSAENAAILEKVRAFKQLRRDIDEDLAADELTASIIPKGRTRHNV